MYVYALRQIALAVLFSHIVAGCGGGGGGGSSPAAGPKLPTGGGIVVGAGVVVSSVSPASGAPGSIVTIWGSGFATSAAGEVVRFAGTPGSVVATSSTQLSVVVPSVPPGQAPVTVQVGISTSTPYPFTVTAPPASAPVLGALSPTSGPVGTSVLLTGSNLAGVVAVRIGAQSVSTTAGPRFAVPQLGAGVHSVVAVDSSGQASGPASFLVVPVLSSAQPQAARPGDSLTLSGSNFGSSPLEVRFGTVAMASGTPNPAGSSVTVSIPSPFPSSLPATLNLTVAVNAGTAQLAISNALSFTVQAPLGGQTPVLSALSPSSGPPGTIVQATGAAFGTGPTVSIGGANPPVTQATLTSLTFTVPGSLPAGVYNVVVSNTAGSSTPLAFTVTAPSSSVLLVSIDPPGGLPNQLVTLRGAGLGGGAASPTVRFGSLTATVVSHTESTLAVRVPAGAGAGTFAVEVRPPSGGTASNALTFTVASRATGSASGTFARTGTLSVPRTGHSATLLMSGKVLLAGGDSTGGTTSLSSAEVYDPASGAFTPVSGSMSAPRQAHTATLLPDGRVLIAGGHGNPGTGLTIYFASDLYDPATNALTPGPNMLAPRSGHVAVPLSSGDLLLAGGETVSGGGGYVIPTNACEYYRFQAGGSGRFDAAPSLNLGRLQSAAIPAVGGGVVLGGLDAQGELASLEVLDRSRGVWTKGAGAYFMMTIPRVLPTFVRLANGDIAAMGGYSPNGIAQILGEDPMTTADVMPTDPASASAGMFAIRRFPSLPARVGHTTTILADDRVFVVGSARSASAAQSATIFNATLTSGALTAGSPTAGRFDHTATLLFDGRVLIAGGGGDSRALPGITGIQLAVDASAELFQP